MVNIQKDRHMCTGVNPGGVGGRDPQISGRPDFGLGVVGSQRVVDGSRNIIIAYFVQKVCYFAQKVCWKWSFLKKGGTVAHNIAVNSNFFRNDNFSSQ